MTRILVIMATYNGEKYLSEQMDSIFNQKEVTCSVLVRDDGSKDNTLSILKIISGIKILHGIREAMRG